MSRRFLGLHWFGYTQNLTGDDDHHPNGPLWREGRAWLHVSRVEDGPDVTFKAAWHIGSGKTFDFIISVGDALSEDDAGLHLSVPGLRVWLSVRRLLPKAIRHMPGRWLGWTTHHGSIYLYLWADPTETIRRAPFRDARSPKRQPILYIEDWLKGKTYYSDQEIGTVRMEVQMPEGRYPATVRMFLSTWRRAWWPGVEWAIRAHVIPDVPIPIPGKGEDSFNCGDDATYELTTPATTPLAAADALAADVLARRRRYGGVDWSPAEGWPDPRQPR